jgi:urease accessory protein
MTVSSLSRLFQLASPMLPIGAYSYSQGLEWAIESEDVTDIATAQAWIGDVLNIYFANFELPILVRLYSAWQHLDETEIEKWDSIYQAGRDTAETLAESRQMAYSLLRLQKELGTWPLPVLLFSESFEEPAFPTIYAASAMCWDISVNDMLHAYVWSWLENQVSAAMKTVPLGQVAGQRILSSLAAGIPKLIEYATQLGDGDINNFCPALTIASCRHEMQYSRLFRS